MRWLWVFGVLVVGTCVVLAHTTVKPHKHKTAAELEQSVAMGQSMVPLLVNLATLTQAQHNTRDLEIFAPLGLTSKFTRTVFDVLLPASRYQSEKNVNEPALTLHEVYSLMPLYENLPPLRKLSEATERWKMFVGNQQRAKLGADMLQRAYKEIFNSDLSDGEANKMITSLAVDAQRPGESTVSRCEFLLASLKQDYIDDKLLEDVAILWQKRPHLTMDDLLFELGYQAADGVGFQILDRLIFNVEGVKGVHKFSFCELCLAVGVIRNNMYRGFMHPKTFAQLEQVTEDNKFEAFQGKAVFAHSAEEYTEDRETKAELLKNLFHVVDDSGDGYLTLGEFQLLIKTIDMWQDFVPRFRDLEAKDKTVESFANTELTSPSVSLLPHTEKIFEMTWDALAGKKRFSIRETAWDSAAQRAVRRVDPEQLPDPGLVMMHSLPKYTWEGAMPVLYKPEVKNAWFGHPVVMASLSEAQVQEALDLILPTPKTAQCDRQTWTVFAPILHAFATLDQNQDAALTLSEFMLTGATILKRLRHFKALSDNDETEALFKHLVKNPEAKCDLACFTGMFKVGDKVTLKSFLNPKEILGKSYIPIPQAEGEPK